MNPCPEILHHWWQWHPYAGVSVALLAVVGVLVPWLRGEKIDRRERALWTVVMVGLAILELWAIRQTEVRHDNDQAFARCQELQNFKAIATTLSKAIENGNSQFKMTMQQFSDDQLAHQKQFNETMQKFSENETSNQTRFNRLFAHEEQLAEAQAGVLEPGNERTPANACQKMPDGSVMLMLDYDAKRPLEVTVIQTFPTVVVMSRSKGEILSLHRTKQGNVTVIYDLRSNDGKLIARLDEGGFTVNRSNSLAIKKDRNSLEITDVYGVEVIDLRYLNPTAIYVKGPSLGLPRGLRWECLVHTGNSPVFTTP